MEKIFKNRKSGELAYYKDGIFRQGRCVMEIGVEPSSEFWNQILFITEDGVEIFEGGVYYVPQRKDKKYDGFLSIIAVSGMVYNSETKRFASKQKALEFIEDFNKEAVLITNDGVKLFDRDVYYFIWLNKPANEQEIYKVYKAIVRPLDADTTWSSDAVFFSTEESAKKYILMNKPLLSLNDLLSVWGTDGLHDVYKESLMFQNFKNLAKTKL